jgi:hypothetical protein
MPTWEDVLEIAAGLPEVEVSTWFRTPALRIAKKGFVRLRKEDGGLVVLCDLDEKAALLERGDPAFYTTPHYDGFGAILVDLERVDVHTLSLLVTRAWTLKAPARLRKRFPEFERTEPGVPEEPPPAPAKKRRRSKAASS